MPKTRGPAGIDRFNLMMSIIGYTLHNEGEVLVSELADRFGVTPKDIDSALRTIGVSGVDHFRLFNINWDALEEGYAVVTDRPSDNDVPKLSARQAAALIAALQVMSTLDGFDESNEIPELINLLKKGSVVAGVTPVSVAPGTVDADAEVIRKAIALGQKISCDYRNLQGESRVRVLEPLRLVSRDQVWYVQAYNPERDLVAAFRLDRMRSATRLEEQISDQARAATIPDEVFQSSASDTNVTMRVQPEAFRLIAEYGAIKDPVNNADGSKTFTCKIANLAVIGYLVAKYAGYVEVIEPESARKIVRDWALQALGQNLQNELANEE